MHLHRAFTLVEVLVALVLVGIGAAGLATALGGDHRLRESAAAHSVAAGRARERMELLAVLPCLRDSSGTTASDWGVERWRAQVSPSGWVLTDSLLPRALGVPIVIEARVMCAG
jgi:prepilin-type N-terminal cleavage/methylation domain-containing protein